MKKTVVAVAIVFLMGACLPQTPASNPLPNVDVAGTSAANVQTSVVQTLTAQPTITSVLLTETPTAALASPEILSPTLVSTGISETATAITGTSNLVTSTNVPVTVPAGSATLTPTLGILTYGTLPPAVPFSQVILINKSRTQAYISLQVVTEKGGPTIIEYPVEGQVKIKAPIGQYLYVAWVGGRKMVGEFRLHQNEDLTIILYKDKVVVK